MLIQRGDSALRLNVHFHVLELDGVYVRQTTSGALVFQALSSPTEGDLAEVAKRTALRVKKVLARHGRSLDGTSEREDPSRAGSSFLYLWRDGTVALVLEPMDVIARVCALIPPPPLPSLAMGRRRHGHRVRYHGGRSDVSGPPER